MFNLFGNKATGAVPSPKDPRDIPITAASPVSSSLPYEYFTDIKDLEIMNQNRLGACVGHAMAQVVEKFDNEEASPRFIYALSKAMDGYAGEGTFPRVAAKVMQKIGSVSTETVPNETLLPHSEYIKIAQYPDAIKKAGKRKIKSYAWVNTNDINAIKTAIIEHGHIAAGLKVGDWSKAYVKPHSPRSWLEKNNAYHYVYIYGYKGDRFYFVNSWGENWGDKGRGYFKYKDYEGIKHGMFDFIVFTDLDEKTVEEYKAKWPYKYFKPHEFRNPEKMSAELLEKLDKTRELAGIPFRINSSYRTPAENKRAGGVLGSAHLTGEAVDIRARNGAETYKIVKAALEVGFERIGINRKANFVHLDVSKTKPSPSIWQY